jgi:hypothetical protein
VQRALTCRGSFPPAGAAVVALLIAVQASALEAPPLDSPARLDELVAPIALYPDPLLAQVLAAATFHDQIPDAARWADQHRELAGQALALSMQAQRLPWEPEVQAMLPFPAVLDWMATRQDWAARLGDSFLAHQPEVLDAIQRQRRKAKNFGYLRSNPKIAITSDHEIAIRPVNPATIAVPSYDPAAVFAPPHPGSGVDRAIVWRETVRVGGFKPYGWKLEKFAVIGGYFQAWGWGLEDIDWGAHTMTINGAPWRRNWANRNEYAHPYPDLRKVVPAQ